MLLKVCVGENKVFSVAQNVLEVIIKYKRN
jgi:hypothetical protein